MSRWYQTHTHLHAGFEQLSSIRSHAAQAQALGSDVMFLTCHDVRMNRMQNAIETFALTGEGFDACWPNGAGWYHEDGSVCRAKEGALCLSTGERALFSSPGKKHQASLLSELTLRLRCQAASGLRVGIRLSQRPEDCRQQLLCYELGPCPVEDETAWVLPLVLDADGWATLPLSQDVLRFDPLGQDNAFCSIELAYFGEGEALCYGFETSRLYTAEECRVRQQRLADAIGPRYGLRIHAATEISIGPGDHRNSYSAHVPVLTYDVCGWDLPIEKASAYVLEQGGTLCYNHMFDPWKRLTVSPERVDEMIERLWQSRCEGAHLLEVGFPEGRGGYTLADHLRVWDALGCRGLRITGIGDSDCHDSRVCWRDGNNFATWLYAASSERADLEDAMRSGRAYCGDPARWKGTLRFAVNGHEMGEQAPLLGENIVQIELSALSEPLTLRIIAAGEIVYDAPLTENNLHIPLPLCKKPHALIPVRMELWGQDGRCILLSNPVYLTHPASPAHCR